MRKRRDKGRKEIRVRIVCTRDHADANASFNIALRPPLMGSQLHADACKGSTDTPKEATPRMMETLEPFRVESMSVHIHQWKSSLQSIM
ncbi:MAG: hypothetical protein QW431_02970 [Conexivisphaerales archaeon]